MSAQLPFPELILLNEKRFVNLDGSFEVPALRSTPKGAEKRAFENILRAEISSPFKIISPTSPINDVVNSEIEICL